MGVPKPLDSEGLKRALDPEGLQQTTFLPAPTSVQGEHLPTALFGLERVGDRYGTSMKRTPVQGQY